ncbi:MAG: GNAT family N-acetyltransferase [Omnitrophica WOR_2 bacterium]
MVNLLWRSIDQNDLEEIIELSQRCHAVDGGIGFMFEPEPIKSRYLPDGLSSGIGAYDPDGHLAACACVSINGDSGRQRARIVGRVRPDVRGRGIGTYLMQWSQEQARALLAGIDEPQKVMEIATESLTEPAHRLYLVHGFARVFEELVMERDLRLPLPDRPLPQDVTLTNWQPDLAEQFFQAYHTSFRERPGFPGFSATEWIALVTENDHRPDWSHLARIDGEPVGFVIGNIDLTKDPPGGHIWQVGVIPAQRRRGLASVLLVETMRRMQGAGASSALLTVHLNNPGAIQAYSQLGFITVGRRARYEQVIET